MQLLGSLLFYLGLGVATLCLPLLMLVSLPMSRLARQRLFARWASLQIAMLRVFCRLDYRVSGSENIPAGPAIILCKHQSTWETFALQRIFPAQTWVLKRELLLIPVFGWALALAHAIAIDRGSPKQALNQVISKGRERLEKGLWVVIFPEGTRIPVGQAGKYNAGGAMLATRSGYPVVPVAHNAGLFWEPGRLRIRPGTVEVVVGPVLDPTDCKASQLSAEVEQWIEGAMAKITP
jgi:1-acyl-sn-glycerol-3-phosphate acyltransferase